MCDVCEQMGDLLMQFSLCAGEGRVCVLVQPPPRPSRWALRCREDGLSNACRCPSAFSYVFVHPVSPPTASPNHGKPAAEGSHHFSEHLGLELCRLLVPAGLEGSLLPLLGAWHKGWGVSLRALQLPYLHKHFV